MKRYAITASILILLMTNVSDANAMRLNQNHLEDITTQLASYSRDVSETGSDSLSELISHSIQMEYQTDIDTQTIHIEQQNDNAGATILLYTFRHHSVNYMGIMLAGLHQNKWFKLSNFTQKQYGDVRVQPSNSGGVLSLPFPHSRKVMYDAFYGYVHDPNIRQVRLKFTDGTVAIIPLEQGQLYYMNAIVEFNRTGSKYSGRVLDRIEMYSINGQRLYNQH
ncbi:hypothetical protein [Paenibacillus kandeliae]|uniref:hypothetical protein n=1 Tax=Paenibacillus kandeliae TaxID=3231269 RepID=UPI00345A7389